MSLKKKHPSTIFSQNRSRDVFILGEFFPSPYKNGLINYVDNSVNGEFYPYTNLQTLEDLLLIFESGELDWSWLDVYIVNEVSNSEYIDIPNLIGTYITEFNEYFSRGE